MTGKVLEWIAVDEPVDGFAVKRDEDGISITFSNRYSHADCYVLSRKDAARLARAILFFYKPSKNPCK